MSRVDDILSARSRTATGLRLIGSTFVTLGLVLLLGWVAVAGMESLLSRSTQGGFGRTFGGTRSFGDWLNMLRVLGYAGFCFTVGGFLVIAAAPRLSVIWLPLGRGRDCPRCMYPLAGIPQTDCPECGLELSNSKAEATSDLLNSLGTPEPLTWLMILRWTSVALIVGGLLFGGSVLWGIYVAPGGTGGARPSPINGSTMLALMMITGGAALAIWSARAVPDRAAPEPDGSPATDSD